MALPTSNRTTNLPGLWNELFNFDPFDVTNTSAETSNLPAVNFKENDKEFTVEVAAPGLDKKDFNLTVDNGHLIISSEKEEENVNNNYSRREFSYHSFQRVFSLPDNVKEEDIKAEYTNGVLNIHLPKKQESKSDKAKKIEIK